MQSASSSTTPAGSRSSVSAEEREAAAYDPPRRKRRRIATGHGVQQIPETSAVLLPPQQQEQLTLRPVEQRHVAEHQAATTASFTGAEPAETGRPESAAAFVKAPAAGEPMVIETSPAAEEIPLEVIIANFLPQHQEKIRECLNDEGVQHILNAVRNFLTLIRESGIKLSPGQGRIPTPTLFGRLKSLSVTKDAETIRKFFVKATLFFSGVNPAQTKNTGCLSTMLNSKTHITNFVNESEDNLRLLAGNPYLKQITSMCDRKGVPDPVKVAEIIKWDCWKIDGTFSFELLRTFSSMMSGRGLLSDQAQVVEMLAWECLQLGGEFSMELLRAVSSMMNRRGFPDKDTLTAMLAWDCWKIDGQFSIELLRIFSSMMSGCGIPQKEKVEAILAWPCWQVDGKFSFELLRTFSSMSHGRGLIKQAEVERVLAWPCWQVNGKFSLVLLRIFSSMASSRGLLKDEARINAILAWDCWKIGGEFSIDLLRIFSSMMNGQGLLGDEVQVQAILAWNCWEVDGKFSLPLLRTVASMMHRRGLLKKAPVEQLLSWPCWKVNGKFSLRLLQMFSVMMSGRGLLKQTALEEFMAWLPSDHITRSKEQTCLKVACQLFSKTGLPDPKILADIEATLRRYIPDEALTSDEDESSDSEDEPQEMVQIKVLTLFCAAPAKWHTSIGEIEQFLDAHNCAHYGRKAFRAALDSLFRILANHGQAGFQFWLRYYSDNPDRKHALTRALLLSAPLVHTKFALTQFPESEWPEYIELCKNLTPAPDKEQWQALKPLRDLLHRRFTLTLRKRMMLEILWPQSEHNRLRYAEKLDTLLNTVPTIYQLYRLHEVFNPKKLQAFLDACLARQNAVGQGNTEAAPHVKIQKLLLEGLLLTNHYMSDHSYIPELCFSKQIAGADGASVFVDGDADMAGHQRLWHFIAAMLIELKQTEYQFQRQRLRISPPDGEPIVLPMPEFTAANTGFVITNWSLEQLTAFFQATEFTDHWYRNPQDTQDIGVIRREERLEQMMRASPQDIAQTGHRAGYKSSPLLLSPSVIVSIIKQGNQLKPVVWSSLERYAENDQLSDTLCRLLAPIIEKELASTGPDAIPEIVKKTIAQRLGQTGASQTVTAATATQSPSSSGALASASDVPPIISHSQTLPASVDIAIDMALDVMARDMAIEELEHFPVLGRAELDILESWRDQMTYSQLMDVITKIDLQSVKPETLLAWQQTFENRRRDNLGLDLDKFLDSLLEGADD